MLSGLHRGTPLTLERLRPSLKEDPGRALQDEAAQSTPAAWPHQRDFEFNFRFDSGQCVHLVGPFLRRLPQRFQLLVCGAVPLSGMEGHPWWVSPLCQGDFRPLCSFPGWQKEAFLSLANHNLSLLACCKTCSQ